MGEESLVPYSAPRAGIPGWRCGRFGAMWMRRFALSRLRGGSMGIGCRLWGAEAANRARGDA
jgi:hypothetical protein